MNGGQRQVLWAGMSFGGGVPSLFVYHIIPSHSIVGLKYLLKELMAILFLITWRSRDLSKLETQR